jgi:catechol 2,3-dioxygenase-like lactoylglutathione lyase family enzyme
MIGYVTIGTDDFDTALPFYDAVFAAIGGERKSYEGNWAMYGRKGREGDVAVCKPFDGKPAKGGNGIMLAFNATTTAAVDEAYAAGLALGGKDEGPPGLRPPEGGSFYGAYLRDPTGNKICFYHLVG